MTGKDLLAFLQTLSEEELKSKIFIYEDYLGNHNNSVINAYHITKSTSSPTGIFLEISD